MPQGSQDTGRIPGKSSREFRGTDPVADDILRPGHRPRRMDRIDRPEPSLLLVRTMCHRRRKNHVKGNFGLVPPGRFALIANCGERIYAFPTPSLEYDHLIDVFNPVISVSVFVDQPQGKNMFLGKDLSVNAI